MYDTLLFLHFFGVSIGAGTGFYMLAVHRYAARNLDQAEARTLMPGIAATISRVGTIGLALLILSGVGMALMMGDVALTTMFVFKMVLVSLIVVFVFSMKRMAGRVQRNGDMKAALRMKKLGFAGPLLGTLTILAAVSAFH